MGTSCEDGSPAPEAQWVVNLGSGPAIQNVWPFNVAPQPIDALKKAVGQIPFGARASDHWAPPSTV